MQYNVGLLSDGSDRADRFRRVLNHFNVSPREVRLEELEQPEVITDEGVGRTIEEVERLARSRGGS